MPRLYLARAGGWSLKLEDMEEGCSSQEQQTLKSWGSIVLNLPAQSQEQILSRKGTMCPTEPGLSNTVLAFVDEGWVLDVVQETINTENRCWGARLLKVRP